MIFSLGGVLEPLSSIQEYLRRTLARIVFPLYTRCTFSLRIFTLSARSRKKNTHTPPPLPSPIISLSLGKQCRVLSCFFRYFPLQIATLLPPLRYGCLFFREPRYVVSSLASLNAPSVFVHSIVTAAISFPRSHGGPVDLMQALPSTLNLLVSFPLKFVSPLLGRIAQQGAPSV